MSIATEPHYELPATELAAWIEQQGDDCWWTVDGDYLLTGLKSFPCPGDELAQELRQINRPLLMKDKYESPNARGQTITRDRLDDLVSRIGDKVQYTDPIPDEWNDRLFFLCWKGSDEEWMLLEDKQTTKKMREDMAEASQEVKQV